MPNKDWKGWGMFWKEVIQNAAQSCEVVHHTCNER